MWGNLSIPWRTCLELAWESYCDDCVPIGAVITDAEGAILSKGRNRKYPKRLWKGKMPGVHIAHAEAEALHSLDYNGIDPHACGLYTSMEPCPMCMGAFYMSGLRTLHFASRDPYAGAVDMLGKTDYLNLKPIQVLGPFPELETLLIGMAIDHECNQSSSFPPVFYQKYCDELPDAVQFGHKLFDRGFLQELRLKGATAQDVFEGMASLLGM